MRNLMLVVLMLAAMTSLACKREKPVAKDTAPLVPTAKEREQLGAFKLTANSPKGQKKLHELRVNQKRIDEARAQAQAWVEEARKRREMEAKAESGL